MEDTLPIRQSTPDDYAKLKETIDLSFPRIFRYFANHSVTSEEGKVLVSKTQAGISGFVKLIEFNINSQKYGCILWIAIQPSFRRRGIALRLTNAGIDYLKNDGARAIFASTQKRNNAAKATLGKAGFRQVGFLGLWRVFSWRVFSFFSNIWYAPGEVVFVYNFKEI
ncbi:MAG TPA: GNAT family N-acetyltransferase [Candidatus Bathyarchaeia archaeon]